MKTPQSFGLLVVLALTLLATWYAATMDAGIDAELVVTPRDKSKRSALPDSAAQTRVLPSALNAGNTKAVDSHAHFSRKHLPETIKSNPFAVRSWQPPPPAPISAPPPPPRAPALPFRYLGRLEDGDQVVVFLAQDNRELVVRQGDKLPNYRIDEISKQGMRMTYLPLNETQRMLFGGGD
jgi:hypothetical protein